MKDNLEEYLKNDLRPASYPFEEKHWDSLKSRMYNRGRMSALWLFGAIIMGIVQISVTHPHIIESHFGMSGEVSTGISEVVEVSNASVAVESVIPVEVTQDQEFSTSQPEQLSISKHVDFPSPQNACIEEATSLHLQPTLENLAIESNPKLLEFPETPKGLDISFFATPQFSDVGLNTRFHISESLYFSTGVNYYSTRMNYETPGRAEQNLTIQDNSYWTTQSNSAWMYTDSALTAIGWVYTDSAFVTTVDSSYTVQLDSSLVVNNVPAQQSVIMLNKVSVPLVVGLNKQFGRTELGLQLGGSIDYLVSAKTSGTEQSDSYTTTEINYSLLAGAYIEYQFTEHLSVGIQPNYRRSLRPDVKVDGQQHNASKFNVRALLRVRLH